MQLQIILFGFGSRLWAHRRAIQPFPLRVHRIKGALHGRCIHPQLSHPQLLCVGVGFIAQIRSPTLRHRLVCPIRIGPMQTAMRTKVDHKRPRWATNDARYTTRDNLCEGRRGDRQRVPPPNQNRYGTWGSQVIPQPSTSQAQPRLTSEF